MVGIVQVEVLVGWLLATGSLVACSSDDVEGESRAEELGDAGFAGGGAGGASPTRVGDWRDATTPQGGESQAGELSDAGFAGGGAGGAPPTHIGDWQDATTPEECAYYGAGGADFWMCDYVDVRFSEPVPAQALSLEVTTSLDATALPETNGFSVGIAVRVGDTGLAQGFSIQDAAGAPHYAPDWVDVVATESGTVIADARLEPTYSCVALTSDDWCWQGEPLELPVTRP